MMQKTRPKAKVTAFRLDPEDQARLESAAAHTGVSAGEYARRVLHHHLSGADQQAVAAKLNLLTQAVRNAEEGLGLEIRKLSKLLLHFLKNTEVLDGGKS